jgi:hypothetical protein
MSPETTNRWRIRPHESPAAVRRPGADQKASDLKCRGQQPEQPGPCHAPSADAQARWRLDRNYLVVEASR